MRILFFITTLLFIIPNMFGQKEYRLNSPDGKLEVTLYIGDRITYELTEEGHTFRQVVLRIAAVAAGGGTMDDDKIDESHEN